MFYVHVNKFDFYDHNEGRKTTHFCPQVSASCRDETDNCGGVLRKNYFIEQRWIDEWPMNGRRGRGGGNYGFYTFLG